MNPLENTIIGILCGAFEVSLLQPTLYWKNAFQQDLPFTLKPSVLYRGYIPSVVNNSAMIGSQFALAGMLKSKYSSFFKKNPENDHLDSLLFGTFVAGYISGFWCGPIELAMIQQQRFGMTLKDCIKKILGEFGLIKGVFRGTFNTSAREGTIHNFLYLNLKALYCMGYLGIVPSLSPIYREKYNLNPMTALFAASLTASAFAISLSHPFDTMKTILQGDLGIIY